MRYNIKNHFEEVYLRTKTLKKYLQRGTELAPVDDVGFWRCINYMATSFFRTNRALLASNGFEYQDLYNITIVFGIVYFGLPRIPQNREHQYRCMMRFLRQRLTGVIHWVAKKFHVQSGAPALCNNVEPLDNFYNTLWYNNLYCQMLATSNNVNLSYIEQIQFLYWQLDNVAYHIENLRQHGTKDINVIVSYIQAQRRLKSMIHNLRSQYKQLTGKAILHQLKSQLDANPNQYRDILAYYATCGYVSIEIRKVAQQYCKKYNIDYIAWAQKRKDSYNFIF